MATLAARAQLIEPGPWLHEPYRENNCAACHQDADAPSGADLIHDTEQLCFACHGDMATTASLTATFPLETATTTTTSSIAARLHGVSISGGAQKNGCLSCHRPHGAKRLGLLRESLPSRRDFCATQCHADELEQFSQRPFRHEVSRRQDCLNCHFAHKNEGNRFLREDNGLTCLSCHNLPVRKGGRRLASISLALEAPFPHEPTRGAACASCHEYHGSQSPYILRASYPALPRTAYRRAAYSLCYECHDPALIETETVAESASAPTDFRDGAANLHYRHVVAPRRGRACDQCHAIHGSEQDKLIREDYHLGLWQGTITYQRSDTGGRCDTPCHTPMAYDRKNPLNAQPTLIPSPPSATP